MGTAVFDTLAYAKKLREAGVPERQAEVQAEALAEIADEKLATKADLEKLGYQLKRDIKDLEYRLLIKLGVMLAASITIVSVVVKLAR